MAKQKDWEKEWKDLQARSRKLAKRANQRLVRLERYAERPGMSQILSYAYKSAMKDITTTGKTGKQRFYENPKLIDVYDDNGNKIKEKSQDYYKKNVQRLRIRTKAIESFLEAATSTLGQGISKSGKTKGIKNVYDKRTGTINEKFLEDYELQMTSNDMKRFFDSKKQKKLEKEVGSDKMFVVASVLKKYNIRTNKRDLEKFFRSHIDLSKYNLTEEDLKAHKGESYKEYFNRLKEFVSYTGDEVIDDLVNKVISKGLGAHNVFLE